MAEINIEKMAQNVAQKAIQKLRDNGVFIDRWIPVSERLPEDEQEILFSTKTGRVHSGKYHDDDSANQWYSHKDKCRAWNNVVSAWMPLPKPYESQESEKINCKSTKCENCKNHNYCDYESEESGG